jgi:rubrerythrin
MGSEADHSYERLFSVKKPTLNDLRDLMFLEAAGEAFYRNLAALAPNDAVKHLLSRNGQEEMAHAHRLKRVIKMLHGEDCDIPSHDKNPFSKSLTAPPVVDARFLTSFAETERTGETFYQNWADNIGNAEAAKLLTQNGREETRHGDRLTEALGLL